MILIIIIVIIIIITTTTTTILNNSNYDNNNNKNNSDENKKNISKNNKIVTVMITIQIVTAPQINNILQLSELCHVYVAVCGRQCSADCSIVLQIPVHK